MLRHIGADNAETVDRLFDRQQAEQILEPFTLVAEAMDRYIQSYRDSLPDALLDQERTPESEPPLSLAAAEAQLIFNALKPRGLGAA
jgi:hypothetical protein